MMVNKDETLFHEKSILEEKMIEESSTRKAAKVLEPTA